PIEINEDGGGGANRSRDAREDEPQHKPVEINEDGVSDGQPPEVENSLTELAKLIAAHEKVDHPCAKPERGMRSCEIEERLVPLTLQCQTCGFEVPCVWSVARLKSLLARSGTAFLS